MWADKVTGFETVHSAKKTAGIGKAIECEIVSDECKLVISLMSFVSFVRV